MNDIYHWLKVIHIIAVISWMCGMLYLPRLFVYHSRTVVGGEASELFKVMELKLMRLIINPAMIVVWIAGLSLAIKVNAFDPQNGLWMHYKFLLVLVMQVVHAKMSRYRKAFARDERPKSERYFRIFNEVPAILMVFIVILVVLRPF